MLQVSTWQALNLSSETEDVQQSWASNTLLAMLPSPVRDMAMYSTTIGWAPLYAGFLPALGATALSQALYFYLYSAARQLIVARAAKHSPAHKSAAPAGALSVFGSTAVASFAGCINVLATNPIWIIATQLMALQKSPNPADRTKGAWDVAVDLYNQGGVGTFWQGVMPAIVMVSNPTIQYILYEWLTTKMVSFRRLASTPSSHTRVQKGSAPSLLLGGLDVFMLSAVAKLGATLATYPLLVIKSRLQAANASTAAEARYSGVLDALIRILGTEGVAGLFKGLRAKLLQTVLGAAILMFVKEKSTAAVHKALLQRSSGVSVATLVSK
ncbi:mitochondrial carrier domain-containing protein [Dunaliella salina]|uniref:Mitochondrial carrier domain-containing protein n=1 Tax=Dunaliella salina TaxID=3046 RepID=A0ABQ7G3X8_DUNSA|nr:mitochondrial carrier domain-containing protein [Dunaliella salina]|eukprot:KAF5829311.1 mitochondrial carrier domain-containing protein [Dunaliella salina]